MCEANRSGDMLHMCKYAVFSSHEACARYVTPPAVKCLQQCSDALCDSLLDSREDETV